MTKKRHFGELELSILALFNSKQQLTVKEAQKLLGGKDKYTTVMTVMSRLAEKKVLQRHRIGLQYLYSTPQAKQLTLPTLLERLKHKIFGGRSAPMISYLIDTGEDITDDEWAVIKQQISQRRQK